ncbi:MAG: YdcF family protein [Acidimicrobiia bacterium]
MSATSTADPTAWSPGDRALETLAALEVVWRYLAVESPPRGSDLLFVFGCANLAVARRAAGLFARGIAPWVLVTGGSCERFGPDTTEADVYASVLIAHGVPAERIIFERAASNTGENVVLGMAVARTHRIDVRAATLVAYPTSLRRAAATFAWHHPRIRVHTQAAFAGADYDGDRPDAAIALALSEIERLRTYPDLGYFARQAVSTEVDEAAARLRAGLERDGYAGDALAALAS